MRIILLGIEAQSTNWTTDCYGANSATGPNLRQYRRAPNAGIPRFPKRAGIQLQATVLVYSKKLGKKGLEGKAVAKHAEKQILRNGRPSLVDYGLRPLPQLHVRSIEKRPRKRSSL